MKVALKVKYICEGQPLVAWWCVCFDVLRSVLWEILSWRSFRSKVPLSENTHLHPQSRIQINSHSFYSARSKKAKWQEMARDGKLWRSLRAKLCSLSSGNHFFCSSWDFYPSLLHFKPLDCRDMAHIGAMEIVPGCLASVCQVLGKILDWC